MSDPYTSLATEVCGHPEVMPGLGEWFNSERARSSFPFGRALGQVDDSLAVADTVQVWLSAGQCENVVSGYLRGLADRFGTLPPDWQQLLDRVAAEYPNYATRATLTADASLAGFRRILAQRTLASFDLGLLGGLGYDPWPDVLSDQDKQEVLQTLWDGIERDASAVSTALRLVTFWSDAARQLLPEGLQELVLGFVSRAIGQKVDAHDWLVAARLLAGEKPQEVAFLLIQALTGLWEYRVRVEEEALKILKAITREHPSVVMEAVGQRILDPESRWFFGVLILPGLFEAIGQPVVQRWLESNGTEHLRAIARHLDSPSLDSAGQGQVPPLTLWVLTTFEEDDHAFRAFCAGRPRGAVWGHARDRRAEVERRVSPFLSHPARRIREWAQYELDLNAQQVRWDDHSDDMCERG